MATTMANSERDFDYKKPLNIGSVFGDTEDDFDIDIDIENDFVGRENDLQELSQAWKDHKLFGIFGLRSVGKSRLVREFLTRQNSYKFTVIKIDMKLLQDISALYTNICAALGLEPEINAVEGDRWIPHVVRSLKSVNGKKFIFFFDNTEDYQDLKGVTIRDGFLSLCTSLLRQCRNVKMFITSTMRVQLSQLKKVYFSYEVLPLKQTETSQLLKSVTPGIELGEYEQAIVKLSEGLPLLILMIGSELTEDGGMVTPKDIVELLLTCRLRSLSREFYPDEDRVADVYKKFIDRLDVVYRRHLTVLEYIPGTFNADQAKEMLDFKTEAMVKDKTLIPIRRRHILNYDPTTRRFSIQGILRECVKAFYTIKNISEIRTKYCHIFSTVMQTISARLGTVEYTKALAEFAEEQPNLHKLLIEVKYTNQDTYHFFIEMATNCTGLIERFMAGDGDDFYQGCLKAADMYGQDNDKASVNIAVGSMYTNIKGNLVRGEHNYESALAVLQSEGRSLLLATAYQKLGWNMLQQGKNQESIGLFKKSLAISLVSGEEYQLLALQSMSSMGVTLTVLGRFEDAERYHFACLNRRRLVQGNDHPSVGSSLNNIGIMYDQKGDSESAIKYYKEGLEIKQKSKAPTISIVLSLSNTANMSAAMGKSEEAHTFLDEALDKLRAETIPPRGAMACTYDTKGKVFRREGKLRDAEELFIKAVDIRGEISSDNITYMESLVHLADINKRQGHLNTSIKIAKEALTLKDKATASMPQNTFVLECFECIADVYKMTDDPERYKETLEKIESELLRLENVFLCQCNERGLQRIRDQLNEIQIKLKNSKAPVATNHIV